jgi:hypothetical protein
MKRAWDAVLAASLLLFFLPLLAWTSIPGGLHLGRDRRHRTKTAGNNLLKKQITAEFNFERAIEAYEELIDSTFAEGRL